MAEHLRRWLEIHLLGDEHVEVIGYSLDDDGRTPILWRGYPRRHPPLVTYQQWREFLLSVKQPRVYFQGCKWTGEAFIQCLEANDTTGKISPAEFRGLVFRRTKDGMCFLDQGMPSDVMYGTG